MILTIQMFVPTTMAMVVMIENDELKILMLGLKRFTKSNPVNIKENRRKIAKKIIQEESYCF